MKFGMLFLLLCLALPAQAQGEEPDTTGIVEGVDVSMEGEKLPVTADTTALDDEADIVHPVTLEDLKAYVASCTAETKEIVGYYLSGDPIYEMKKVQSEPTFIGFIEWLEKKEGK